MGRLVLGRYYASARLVFGLYKVGIMLLLIHISHWGPEVAEGKVLPEKGFYNEDFDKHSLRYANRGQSIMGDYIPVFVGSKSDGKARVEMNNFSRWWKCKEMCDSCLATNPQYKGDAVYKARTFCDFRREAGWRDTLIDDDQYAAKEMEPSPMAVITGWRKSLVLRDWAHMDNLGFGRDLGGGLIKSFHKRGELLGGDIDSQLRWLWGEIQKLRKNNKQTRIGGHFTPALVGLDNMYQFPALGSSFKAKRVEIINKFLCKMAVTLAEKDDADEICKIRGTMAWGYLEMHRVLDDADLFLSQEEVDTLKFVGETFLTTLQKLANLEPNYMWKLRPKHHVLDHTLLEIGVLSYLNPKRICCLAEEDFLGKMKLATKGCRGNNMVSMMGRMVDRYILTIALRWRRRKQLGTFRIPARIG